MLLDNPSVPEGYVAFASSQPSSPCPTDTHNRTLEAEQEAFRWSEVVRGLLDLRMWLTGTAYLAIVSGLYSFGLFVSRVLTATPEISLLMTRNLAAYHHQGKWLRGRCGQGAALDCYSVCRRSCNDRWAL
jgi:hypothetical protein